MAPEQRESSAVGRSDSKPLNYGSGAWFLGPLFLLVAVWFFLGMKGPKLPETKMRLINKAAISTAPRRKMIAVQPPKIHINGFDRTCNDCHNSFKSETPKLKGRLQHQEITLEHAINKTCYSCHDKKDRNYLVSLEGKKIEYPAVVQLCAQCHVRVHKDWVKGSHGRSNGYWDSSKGPRKQLKCTQCHDPHQPRHPAMDPLKPLPGPHTLRMGDPGETEAHESEDVLYLLKKRGSRGRKHNAEKEEKR
ncbi:MAG TPA: hypothetical protein ENK02_04040 [Planctomycetes bacterium]|nr:hypothetical protein [Planctomycetota bacterium]